MSDSAAALKSLRGKGKLTEAIACYQEAVKHKPDYTRAYYSLGNALMKQRKPEEAIGCYRKVIELDRRHDSAHYNLGNAYARQGEYELAVEAYDQALAQRPGWSEATANRDLVQALIATANEEGEEEQSSPGGEPSFDPDEIVFDDSGRVSEGGSEVETEGGETLSEEEMRSVWLRRVQNDPADFLRSRFAYQLYRQEQAAGDE